MNPTPRLEIVRPLLKPAFALAVALVALALAVLPQAPCRARRCRHHHVLAPTLVRQSYLLTVPHDAWGHPLRLVCPSRHEPIGFDPCDVSSAGPDGVFGTRDDINSWEL
jgi:hypothetical protein